MKTIRNRDTGIVHIERPTRTYFFGTACDMMVDPKLLEIVDTPKGMSYDTNSAPTCLWCVARRP